jgi:hypothetical protein
MKLKIYRESLDSKIVREGIKLLNLTARRFD